MGVGEWWAATLLPALDGHPTEGGVEPILSLVGCLIIEVLRYGGPLGALFLEELEKTFVLLLGPLYGLDNLYTVTVGNLLFVSSTFASCSVVVLLWI